MRRAVTLWKAIPPPLTEMSKSHVDEVRREAIPVRVLNAAPESFTQVSIHGKSVLSSPRQRPVVIERAETGFTNYLAGLCPPVGKPDVSFWTGGIGEFEYEGKFALAFQRMDRVRGRVSVISPPIPSVPAFDAIPTVSGYESDWSVIGTFGDSDGLGGQVNRVASVFYLGTAVTQNVRIVSAGGAYRSVTVWLDREGEPGGALYAQLYSVKWIDYNPGFGWTSKIPVPDQPLTDGSEQISCSAVNDTGDPAFVTFRFKTPLVLGEGWYALVLTATAPETMGGSDVINVMGYDFAQGDTAQVTGASLPTPAGWDSEDWSDYVTVPWTPPTSLAKPGYGSLEDVVGRFITFSPQYWHSSAYNPVLAGTVVAATAASVTVAPAVYHEQTANNWEYNFGGFDYIAGTSQGSFEEYIAAGGYVSVGGGYAFMTMRLNPDEGRDKLSVQAYYEVKNRGWTISNMYRLQGDHATDTYDAIRAVIFTPELGEWKELAIFDRPYEPPS